MGNPDKIESFKIDHDLLDPGFYISRIDGDIVTYDLRTRKPNMGSYMDNITMHSVEHMFATFVRSSAIRDDVVYFGPMGCQTGFYLLVKNQAPEAVFNVTKSVIEQILAYEGEVFGASQKECGNFRNLSLATAKAEMQAYYKVLSAWEDMTFAYKQ